MKPAFPALLPVVVAALAAGVLTGCNVGPRYHRPAYQAPPAFSGVNDVPVSSDPQTSLGDQRWSEIFREPELQALITQALANNFDLHVAAQRILEQQQQVRITRSQAFPQISGGGTGVGAEFPGNLGSNISSPITLGSLNLSVAWTPDFWGIYRKQTEAARAQPPCHRVWAQQTTVQHDPRRAASPPTYLRAPHPRPPNSTSPKKTIKIAPGLTQSSPKPSRQGGEQLRSSDVRQAEQLLYTAESQSPRPRAARSSSSKTICSLLARRATPGPIPRGQAVARCASLHS